MFVSRQIEGESAVLVAGDPEREHMRKVEKNGGIHYHVSLMNAMVRATQYELDFLDFYHIN